MDQSQMLSLIGGFYDKLVSDVADKVTTQITAAFGGSRDCVSGLLQS
jgi:hypothetical protein